MRVYRGLYRLHVEQLRIYLDQLGRLGFLLQSLVGFKHVFEQEHQSQNFVLAGTRDHDLTLFFEDRTFDFCFEPLFGNELEVCVAA